MIRLVGPGGAGKTSTGRALASRLGAAFVDLDERFMARVGDISSYLDANGYDAYTARNLEVYLEVLASLPEKSVMALSSGFMTYDRDAHPAYRHVVRDVLASSSTVVLLPSLDLETCVTETVRRQMRRRLSRPAQREEQVIRMRFGVYCDLPARKIETMKPIDTVVDNLGAHLRPRIGLEPT
jgi:shikimate kinase